MIIAWDELKKKALKSQRFSCAPTGIRTLVLALKGLRPGPLDDGGVLIERGDFTIAMMKGQGKI